MSRVSSSAVNVPCGVDGGGDVVGVRLPGATYTYSVLAAPPLLPVSPWTMPMSATSIERGAVVGSGALGARVVGGGEDARAVDGVDDFIDGRGAGVVDRDGQPLGRRVVGGGGGVAEAAGASIDDVDVVEADARGVGGERQVVAGAGERQGGAGGAGRWRRIGRIRCPGRRPRRSGAVRRRPTGR